MKINNFIFHLFLFLIFICLPKVSTSAETCPDGPHKFFSPDKSWHVCHLEIDGKHTLAVNGRAKTLYDWVSSPDFSSNSERMAYKARNNTEWFVVQVTKDSEEKKGKSYNQIESAIWDLNIFKVKFFVFGPRGNLSYLAREGDKWFVISEDKQSPAYDWARPIIFSNNGKKLSYKARVGDEWFVVVNNKRQKSYDWVGFPMWSPNSKDFSYKARVGDEWFVVVNNKRQKSYDWVGFPMWSPDSKKLSYKARIGNSFFVVVSGKEGPNYEEIVTTSKNGNHQDFDIFPFVLDSNRQMKVIYHGRKGSQWFLVEQEIDGSYIEKPTAGLVEDADAVIVKVKENKIKTMPVHKLIKEYRDKSEELRSLTSRMETRLDKLSEKEGRQDFSLISYLFQIRLQIQYSEEKVKLAEELATLSSTDKKNIRKNLNDARGRLVEAREVFANLISLVKNR